MSEIEHRPSNIPWPPLIYVAAIALAIILNWLVPLPWLTRPTSDLLFAVGIITVVAVVAIDAGAMRALKRGKTTIMPHRGSEYLVTDGPFSFSRNPLYLGNTLLMIGIALITGIVWFLLLAILAGFATQKLAIEREEQHLTIRFGKKYRDYAKRVRRWI